MMAILLEEKPSPSVLSTLGGEEAVISLAYDNEYLVT